MNEERRVIGKGQSVLLAIIRANLWCLWIPAQSVYIEKVRDAGWGKELTVRLVATCTGSIRVGDLEVQRVYYERQTTGGES